MGGLGRPQAGLMVLIMTYSMRGLYRGLAVPRYLGDG